MADENTAPENEGTPPILPPKIFEQLAMMQAGGAVQPEPEPPKRKLKTSILLWILIAFSAGILAFVFFSGPLKKAGGETDAATQPASAAPVVPMNPRVSLPLPTDAEIDASPVPPPGSDLLAELDKKLSAEISTGEGGLKPLIGKAGLSLLDFKYGLTDEDLKGQNPDAKVLASIYQDMFKRMGEQLGKDNGNVLADIDLLAAEQGRLLESLEEWQGLQIAKVVLCQRVSGFGRYEAFSRNEFARDSTPLILVYAELVNFKTRTEDNGHFVVKLKEELSIGTGSGEAKEVWKEREVSVTDAASSRRRDFFIAQYLNLPKTLEPGTYNLHVKITDEADGKVAVSIVPLTITAK